MRVRRQFLTCAALLGTNAVWASATAQAPREERGVTSGQLINLDVPGVLDKGILGGRLDVRAFGGDEDLLYTSLAAHLGVGRGWEGILRGSFADRKTLALTGGGGIRHGGNDVELLAKYAFKPASTAGSHPVSVAGLIGVSFPSTPAIGDTHLTIGLSAEAPLGRGSAMFINPRAAFIEDNTIVGLGLGARIQLSDRIALVADYTPIVTGDNTRDTATGATKRRDVYGAAVRFSSAGDRFSVDLGFTNATGSTTGFGLTPGLGGSAAFYISLTARR